MGDRATCVILLPQRQDATIQPVYVYTHWKGAELPQRVAQGLYDGRPRWGEPSYMCRILITSVLAGDLDAIDGYGVGLIPFGIPADVGRPQLVVDLRRQRAGFVPWAETADAYLLYDFEAFIGVARWP